MAKRTKSFLGLNLSRAGSNTLVLLLGGLLLLYVLFRNSLTVKKAVPGPGKILNDLREALTEGGYNPEYAQWWLAVSAFETADWTSNLFLNNFNLWGMKQPQKRLTTSVNPKGETWAKYNSVEDAARDIVLYMNDWGYPKEGFGNVDGFVTFMKSVNYFEAPLTQYLAGVKSKL